jgi:hypothetical protein
LNPYALRRQILSLVRLPISPPRPFDATNVTLPVWRLWPHDATGECSGHPGGMATQAGNYRTCFPSASTGRAGRSLSARLVFSNACFSHKALSA